MGNKIKKISLFILNRIFPNRLEHITYDTFEKDEKLKKLAFSLSLSDIVYLVNLSQFIALCALDIAVLTKAIIPPFRTWKKRIYARQLAIILYELSEDVPCMLGKRFREILMSDPINDYYQNRLNELRNRFAQF